MKHNLHLIRISYDDGRGREGGIFNLHPALDTSSDLSNPREQDGIDRTTDLSLRSDHMSYPNLRELNTERSTDD
jgi:hypothetical protein